jgi:hypothetical protein
MINYSITQRFVHDLFLKYDFIKKTLFDIEYQIFKDNLIDSRVTQNIFVGGLARAGTTAFLNYIYSCDSFASLTYSVMPYSMAPNLSGKIISNSNNFKLERAHGDNIFIDQNSPEALDEIFLSTYDDIEIRNLYPEYISLILKSQGKNRYLSKNNNNLYRIQYLTNVFKNSKFILLIRDPLNHANSLLNQHINFKGIQTSNKFALRYMDYLGHHEFGMHHISWFEPVLYDDFMDINYWLEQWYMYYQFVEHNLTDIENVSIISYESLSSKSFVNKLSQDLDIKSSTYKFENYNQPLKLTNDKNLLKKAQNLYRNLSID